MENKKIKGSIKYIILIGLIVLSSVNFVLLIEIKNSLYDTFYATNVNFDYSSDKSQYSLTFEAVSAQNKSYSSETLYFHFNCYNENGALVDNNVIVKIREINYGERHMFLSRDGSLPKVSSPDINYCELSYVSKGSI